MGSKYILFGGADAHQQHFDDVHCFDAAANSWEKVRSIELCSIIRSMIGESNNLRPEFRMRHGQGVGGVDLANWRLSS